MAQKNKRAELQADSEAKAAGTAQGGGFQEEAAVETVGKASASEARAAGAEQGGEFQEAASVETAEKASASRSASGVQAAGGGFLTVRAIDTPCIVIRSDTVDANIAAMAAAAARRGVQLRPHVKTHKLPELAHRQLAAGACGITAAKLSEAEVMADHGIRDIFIAYPVIGAAKAERAARLARRCRLVVGVDSAVGAQQLSAAAEAADITLEVRLEIESGLQRTGVLPERALPLAEQIMRMPGLRLTGIFTYRGALLGGAPTLELRAAGLEEGRLMAGVAEALRREGVPIQDVSVGSTPTAIYAAEVPGVTEIRPGTYVFQDRMQAAFGVCRQEECAAEVWATVISRPAPDRIVIDGGSKTFATDVQPNKAPLHLEGFGRIIGLPHAVFERMNEEHGVILIAPEDTCEPGDVLRIVPNHICSTMNLHNSVYINGREGLRQVEVAARGCIQ
ncbi:alanine racemase [Paenibacillus pasadenensis]|uniref:alanine racemase n=1 Tax=Paenibacillus pasadenensis TaxID=217090 RepID=UPI0020407A2F|nr:alanine racemase [Paenibacillus pasadenensis]MCM3749424.1 alanine racemase [Paenibacillus pasadenensis]